MRSNLILQQLGTTQREYQACLGELQNLRSQQASARASLEALSQEPRAVSEYRLWEEYISGHSNRIIAAQHRLEKSRKKVEKILRIFLLAKRQLKSIENLRDRQRTEFYQFMRKRDQKRLEDMTLSRWQAVQEEA
jgi:flagellar export protein FliJ